MADDFEKSESATSQEEYSSSTESTVMTSTKNTEDDKYKIITDELFKQINTLQEKTKSIQSDLNKQNNRNIEIIGLFASVLALLIINVNIVLAAKSLLYSLILIIALTCSISIFAILIHHFFNPKRQVLGYHFWVPNIVILILLLIAIVFDTRITQKINGETEDKPGIIINNSLKPQINSEMTDTDTIKLNINNRYN